MPRRVLAAAAAAALVVTVLTGCRSDPRVAAYINGKTITEAQVDSFVDNARKAADRNAAQAGGGNGAATEHVPTRAEAVSVLATQEIARQTLADKNLTKAQVDPDQVAQQFGVPAGSGYAGALTDVVASIIALENAAGNAQPSDAELRDVYDRAVAKGLAAPGTFDQIRPQLLQVTGLPQDISARNELAKSAARAGVTVNPRYTPLEFPVETLSTQDGRSFVAVALPLGRTAAGGAVMNTAPTPVASAAD